MDRILSLNIYIALMLLFIIIIISIVFQGDRCFNAWLHTSSEGSANQMEPLAAQVEQDRNFAMHIVCVISIFSPFSLFITLCL